MRKAPLLAAAGLLFWVLAAGAGLAKVERVAGPLEAVVVAVVDGDTFDADIFYPTARPSLRAVNRERVRLRGLDTPETRGKCAAEKALAAEASARLAALLGASVTLSEVTHGEDPWGRTLARVATREGVDPAAALIALGLARAWDGKGARRPWCP